MSSATVVNGALRDKLYHIENSRTTGQTMSRDEVAHELPYLYLCCLQVQPFSVFALFKVLMLIP